LAAINCDLLIGELCFRSLFASRLVITKSYLTRRKITFAGWVWADEVKYRPQFNIYLTNKGKTGRKTGNNQDGKAGKKRPGLQSRAQHLM